MVPRTILTRSGSISVNTTRPVNTVQSRTTVNNAGPMKNGNRSYLTDLRIDGGFVAFGTLNVVVLSPDFKLTDESHVLLKVPRKDNMYNVDLKNVILQVGLTCLFAKATPDESNLWHRRLGQCRKLALSFIRPFGCPVIMLNTIDHLGSGPNWLFDIDALTNSMNYNPVVAGNQSNGNAGTKACDNADKAIMETESPDAGFKPSWEEEKKDAEDPGNESGNQTKGKNNEVPSIEEPRINQDKDDYINGTNNINTAINAVDPKTSIELPDDPNMHELEDIVYSDDDEDVGAEADMNNLDAFMPISPIPSTRIHKDHPKSLCIEFEKMMHKKFQMSSMGELIFFLGTHGEAELRMGFLSVKTMCACTRYQVNLKVSNLHAVKRIFRYLKGQPKLGLWYPKDSPFDLVAYTDSDYAGTSLDKKSTKRGCQFLGCRLISWQCKKQTVVANSTTKSEYIPASNCCRIGALDPKSICDKRKVIITESTIRRDLQLEDANGVDCLPNAAIFEQLTLMGYEKLSQKLTFHKAFFSPQWKFIKLYNFCMPSVKDYGME
ncbi:hypothetical protein Tco_1437625 [Tanacetum coccineum]